MYRLKSTKYIAKLALILALLVCISLITITFRVAGVVFQITDGFFIALCALAPGPGMLLVGAAYGAMMDTIAGSLVYMPATIAIHMLMFFVVKMMIYFKKAYCGLFLASLTILLYVGYTYFINFSIHGNSLVIRELVVDCVQMTLTVVISFLLYTVMKRTNIKSNLFQDYSYFAGKY